MPEREKNQTTAGALQDVKTYIERVSAHQCTQWTFRRATSAVCTTI